MTERTHGLGFGRFVAGFIGIVAMAALITGAVAASNAPSHTVVTADPTDSTLATDTAEATTAATATIVATESPSSAASPNLAMASTPSPTEEVKPGTSCNPSFDNGEDASERQVAGQNGDQNGDNDDQSPNASGSPTLERPEPPTCLKVDPDSHGDQMSGKTAEPSASIVDGDGPGHSRGGDDGSFDGQPLNSLPPLSTFGR